MHGSLFLTALAVLLGLATTRPALAYLDPGTGSIILQSIIGAVAAGLVLGRHYLYRIKVWLGLVIDPAGKNGQQPSE